MKKNWIFFTLVVFFLFGVFSFYKRMENSKLVLVSFSDKASYWIEIADTPEKMSLGLMYRKNMPRNQGMLFISPYPRIISMWMKNTYIPLDMIFFDPFGRVVHVHHNAIPHDETVISSQIPVIGVLEINAGEARKYGIDVNTRLKLEDLK